MRFGGCYLCSLRKVSAYSWLNTSLIAYAYTTESTMDSALVIQPVLSTPHPETSKPLLASTSKHTHAYARMLG